jgi:hypothetical protein
MSDLKELFRERAKKLGMKESKFINRYHNGKVAIELDRRNERLIIVSWENGFAFESKRFRCGSSVEEWINRGFEFAEGKALESAQKSLELQSKRVKHRVRRGQV